MIDNQLNNKLGFIPKEITKEQAKDTGMAMVLISLLIWCWCHNDKLILLAIILLLLDMITPNIFRPVGYIWFGLSNLLGTIMSKVLLTIVFAVLVTPVGIFRRLTGADTLYLKQWKKSTDSVFKVRDHEFEPEEIERPY